MKARDQQSKINAVVVHSAICICLFLSIWELQNVYPVAYAYWVMEDLWGEYATFVCFLLASAIIAWAIRVNRQYRSWWYVLLCLGLFVIAMEEISWGQRLFGLKAPYFFAQYNEQAELTLHNLYIFGSSKMDIFYYTITFWAFFLPVLSKYLKGVKSFISKRRIPQVPVTLLPFFALGIFLFKFRYIRFRPEISEQLFGIAFLLYSIDVMHEAYENAARPFCKKAYSRSLIIGIVALLTLFFVQIRPPEPRLKSFFLHQFATRYYPKFGMNRQADETFRYLMAHKEMKTDETLVQYGMFLQNIRDKRSESILLKALDEQKEQVRLQPKQSRPHYLTGKILALLAQNDSAKQEFEEAIRIDRENLSHAVNNWEKVHTLQSIAENYLQMGEGQLALQELQKANAIVDDAWQKGEIRDSIEKINRR